MFADTCQTGIPNESGRKEILEIYLHKVPHTLQADDVTYLASITHGYVGADLNSLCKEAALKSLKRAYSSLNFGMQHFISRIRCLLMCCR